MILLARNIDASAINGIRDKYCQFVTIVYVSRETTMTDNLNDKSRMPSEYKAANLILSVQHYTVAMKVTLLKIILTTLFITFASYGYAQDMCSSYLDQVSEARSNMVNAKDEVESAQSDVESAQSNLTDCTSDGEDCSMEEDDYNGAVDHYNEANDELQSATDDYNNAVDEYNQCVASDPPPH